MHKIDYCEAPDTLDPVIPTCVDTALKLETKTIRLTW